MALLFFIATLGIGLTATAVSWTVARQRENERELLFVGIEFRDAIALYYNRSPGMVKEFPRDLNDLIQDPRYPNIQRYLRRIYRDPMTGQVKWGTVPAPGGGIMGVYSLSSDVPIKKAGFAEQQKGFGEAGAYMDWKFVYQPPTPVIGVTPTTNSPSTLTQSPAAATASSPSRRSGITEIRSK